MARQRRIETPQQSQIGRSVTYRQLDTVRGQRVTERPDNPQAMRMAQGLDAIADFGVKLGAKMHREEEERMTAAQQEKAKYDVLRASTQLEMAKNDWEAQIKANPNAATDVQFQNEFYERWSKLEGVDEGSYGYEKFRQGFGALMHGFTTKAAAEKESYDKRAAFSQWGLVFSEQSNVEIAKLPAEEREAAMSEKWEYFKNIAKQYGYDESQMADVATTLADMSITNNRHNKLLANWILKDPAMSAETREKAQIMLDKAEKATTEERIKATNDAYLRNRKAIEAGTYDYRTDEKLVLEGYIEGGTVRGWDSQARSNRERMQKEAAEARKKAAEKHAEVSRFHAMPREQVATLKGKDKDAFYSYLQEQAAAMGGDFLTNFSALAEHRGLHVKLAGDLIDANFTQIGGQLPTKEADIQNLASSLLDNKLILHAFEKNRLLQETDANTAAILEAGMVAYHKEGKSKLEAIQLMTKMKNDGLTNLNSKTAQEVVPKLRAELKYRSPITESAAVRMHEANAKTAPGSGAASAAVKRIVEAHVGGWPRDLAARHGNDPEVVQETINYFKQDLVDMGFKPKEVLILGDQILFTNEAGMPIMDKELRVGTSDVYREEKRKAKRQAGIDKKNAERQDRAERGASLTNWLKERESKFK